MAYRVGQLRKPMISTSYSPTTNGFLKPTNVLTNGIDGVVQRGTASLGLFPTINEITGDEFEDQYIQKTSGSTTSFNSAQFIYLRFRVHTIKHPEINPQTGQSAVYTDDVFTQRFKVKLYNPAEEEEERTQQILDITFMEGRTAEEVAAREYQDFETIITPNGVYSHLIFELQRGIVDFTVQKRVSNIEILDLAEIQNIITASDADVSKGVLKIGVQTRPGVIMCVNGEKIRVGRSGQYEINNGVTVKTFGFAKASFDYQINPTTGEIVTDSDGNPIPATDFYYDIDNFIFDYAYSV